MRRSDLSPVGEVLVAYSADEMPTDAIQKLHVETVEEHRAGERSAVSTLQVVNLLLNIAIQKLRTVEPVQR
jgi:hypothetical protein